ncbi:MAG: class II aldolase/adducin family protein, partial [Pseudomonadota bacterium]
AGGHDIRCAGYATFGTQELSDLVMEALAGRKACLMAHHGLIACGRDLDEALIVASEVEALAATYLASLALGEPPALSHAEIDRVLAKIKAGAGYGSGPAP